MKNRVGVSAAPISFVVAVSLPVTDSLKVPPVSVPVSTIV